MTPDAELGIACAILAAFACGWALGRRAGERAGAARVYAAAHDLFRTAARAAVDQEVGTGGDNVWSVPALSEDRSGSCHTDHPRATTRPDSPICNKDG
ncbi:MAG: hypothetical protein ACK4WH_00995 [Phycisphaerales bacterium]